ncbi:MAG: tryptophan synthase subunit alpha [Deltaproteobacteria bacterium]|nr:tryptophan synthase subunit alpha [Deltaproteobacteria bacterium]
MNRIDTKFSELSERGKSALIPFIESGDPDLPTTLKVLHALSQNGADLIELGIPFSDSMADGPTIQRASERALKKGITLTQILKLVREFRKKSDIPIILFGYYNPLLHYGVKRLARDAKAAGVDGLLCVDLPPEEGKELKRWVQAAGLHMIYLLAPTSNEARVRLVTREAGGFIYFVSVTGVTGSRQSFERGLADLVKKLRRGTSLPIGVGFGISTPRQAAWVASFADAVVVGSALINAMEKASRREDKVKKAGTFIAGLKRSMNRVSKKK